VTTTERTTPVLSSIDDALQTAHSVAASVAAGVVERELAGTWPEQELRQVATSGLLGIIVPASFGGPDLPQSTAVEVLRSWTVIASVPKLVAWTRLEASL